MPSINYAEQYARELAQAYPYALNFGALYATPNNGRYRMGEDGKTIYIPNLSTTGRVAADRDTIATATRNYDNAWEPKTLSNQRKWSTLVHPKDIDQTNEVASIANITQTFNEEQKFPEMDAYCIVAWILEQNAKRNFPAFTGGRIKSIVPTLTAYPIEIGSDAARYQIQLRITYRRG